MIAICPAGPPKLMKPSLSQKPNASQKVTLAGTPAGRSEETAPLMQPPSRFARSPRGGMNAFGAAVRRSRLLLLERNQQALEHARGGEQQLIVVGDGIAHAGQHPLDT